MHHRMCGCVISREFIHWEKFERTKKILLLTDILKNGDHEMILNPELVNGYDPNIGA